MTHHVLVAEPLVVASPALGTPALTMRESAQLSRLTAFGLLAVFVTKFVGEAGAETAKLLYRWFFGQ
jgi:hypothetical protein